MLPTGDFVTRGVADMEEWRRVKLLEQRGSSVTCLHASRVAIDLFGDSVYSNNAPGGCCLAERTFAHFTSRD